MPADEGHERVQGEPGAGAAARQFSQLRKLAGLDIVRVQTGQFTGQARISKCGRSLLRWALFQAALGLARTVAGRARLAALKAKRACDRYAELKATVELAAKVLHIAWGVWRRGRPYDPIQAGGPRRQTFSPASRQRDIPTWRPLRGPARGH